jgi:hypothetical protein
VGTLPDALGDLHLFIGAITIRLVDAGAGEERLDLNCASSRNFGL